MYRYHLFVTHLCIDGHVGCLRVLAMVKNAAANAEMHVSFWISVLDFFGWMSRSGITRLNGISNVKWLRNFCTIFYGGCTDSQLHQQCTRVNGSAFWTENSPLALYFVRNLTFHGFLLSHNYRQCSLSFIVPTVSFRSSRIRRVM